MLGSIFLRGFVSRLRRDFGGREFNIGSKAYDLDYRG